MESTTQAGLKCVRSLSPATSPLHLALAVVVISSPLMALSDVALISLISIGLIQGPHLGCEKGSPFSR